MPEREGRGNADWVAEMTGSGMLEKEEITNMGEERSDEKYVLWSKVQTAFKDRK